MTGSRREMRGAAGATGMDRPGRGGFSLASLIAAVLAAFTLALAITVGPSIYRDWLAALDTARTPSPEPTGTAQMGGAPAADQAPRSPPGDRVPDPVDRLLALRDAGTDRGSVARATDELARELRASEADRAQAMALAELALRARDQAEAEALPRPSEAPPVPAPAPPQLAEAPAPPEPPSAPSAPEPPARLETHPASEPSLARTLPAPEEPPPPSEPSFAEALPVPATPPPVSEPSLAQALPAPEAPPVPDWSQVAAEAATVPETTVPETPPLAASGRVAAEAEPATPEVSTGAVDPTGSAGAADKLAGSAASGAPSLFADTPLGAIPLLEPMRSPPALPLRALVVIYHASGDEAGQGRARRLAELLGDRGWTAEVRSVPEPIATPSIAFASDLDRAEAERIRAVLSEPPAAVDAPARTEWPLGRALSGEGAKTIEVWVPTAPATAEPLPVAREEEPSRAPQVSAPASRQAGERRARSRLPAPAPRPEVVAPRVPEEPREARPAPRPRPRPEDREQARGRETSPPDEAAPATAEPRARRAPSRPEPSREEQRPAAAPEPPRTRPEPPRLQARPEPPRARPAAPRAQARPEPRISRPEPARRQARPEPRNRPEPVARTERPRSIVRREQRPPQEAPTGAVAPSLPAELLPTLPSAGGLR